MLRLIISGDVMLGAKKIDEIPDADILYDFGKADLIVGNLESPIVRHVSSRPNLNKIPLWSDAGNVDLLKHYGFTHFSLNNNHTMDLFEDGLEETVGILGGANIQCFGLNYNGISQYECFVKNGIKLGLLAVNWVETRFNKHLFHDLETLNIRKFKATSDFLIVLLHWGDDHNIFINRDQQETARRLIDEGVDLIIGHHPHVPQGYEIYKGKHIFYSLGNFIFTPREEYSHLPYAVRYENQREDILFQRLECKTGLYVRIVFNKASYSVVEVKPVYREHTLPAPLPGHLLLFYEELLRKMNEQVSRSDYCQNEAERKRILTSYTLPLIFKHPLYWPIFFKKIGLRKVVSFLKGRPVR